jgi:hypothetical protein
MRRRFDVPFFAISIFSTSFLLFSIQPLISKAILPWFGGAPAVWTICMLFFQVMLLLGYAAAHALDSLSNRFLAAALYFSLLAFSFLSLNVMPDPSLKPDGIHEPTGAILAILALHIGLPFLVLSMASPLLQVWLTKTTNDESPYWLYSVSNIGSLLALLSYPFFVEPLFDLSQQAEIWSYLFIFAICLLALANFFANRRVVPLSKESFAVVRGLGARTCFEIFLFSTCGSVLLLGFTNHVCHDVAVIPLLWILPLAIYLLTFILTFSGTSCFPRGHLVKLGLLLIFLLGDKYTGGSDASVFANVGLSLGTLFVCCMIAHGEIYRRKPNHENLTTFYLVLSAGGAFGGIVLGLLAPRAFSSYLELPLALLALSIYLVFYLFYDDSILPSLKGKLRLFASLLVLVFIGIRLPVLLDVQNESVVYRTRNFFGVLRVVEEDSASSKVRGLRHGRILHGLQYQSERDELRSRTYYRETSGIARALRAKREAQNREGIELEGEASLSIGVIGLGVGEILAVMREGDSAKFYELDPEVGRIATDYFTFLSNSPADVNIIYGDGRLALDREDTNQFDVLFVDAFSSDAIPVHLLTREAFELYFRHLKENGILVVHISNRHMDLSGVVAAVSRSLGFDAVLVKDDLEEAVHREYNNRSVVISRTEGFVKKKAFKGAEVERLSEREKLPNIWTDSYSEVLSSIDWFSSLHRYLQGGKD